MTNPIDTAVKFWQDNVQPVVDQAVQTGGEVADALAHVGEAAGDFGAHVAGEVQQAGPLNVAIDVARYDAATVGQMFHELGQRGPADFARWLVGPDGPSFSDRTALIPGFQEGFADFMDASMQNPMVAGVAGRAFGFEYYPAGDFYTTNEGSMQSMAGFHDIYDAAGEPLGMDLDHQILEFTVGDVEYRVQVWQGSYGFGGAYGGEQAIYTRNTGGRGPSGDWLEQNIDGYYSAATGADQIEMSQTIYDTTTGETLFTNPGVGADDGEHYWNLAIRTDAGMAYEDIGQRGTLGFNDPDVAAACYGEMLANPAFTDVEISADGLTVSYDWP